jgi:IS5 family transposase
LINKAAATASNVTDADGLKHASPDQGAVYADKGYCIKPAQQTLGEKGCHVISIKKKNMIGEDRDKDRWISVMRAPYERVFAKRCKRVRYKSQAKVQFQVAMNALFSQFETNLRS